MAQASADCCEKHGKRKPAVGPGIPETGRERFPPARCGFRARIRRLKAPGYGPRSPTIGHRASAPGPQPAGADKDERLRASRDTTSRIRDWRIAVRVADDRREAALAGRRDPRGYGSEDARAGSARLRAKPTLRAESGEEWNPDS